ncbi:DUF1801 domain-containing protein [Bowdeniella nasicola]|nr:DUF1801 domain-containing protein [Bowdeniella nasicola]
MAENKTMPTEVSFAEFLQTVPERRQAESAELITMMKTISGKEPVMWGPSIIGFGSQQYRYDSGREGDMPQLSFSPRKSAIAIYFSEGFEHYGTELKELGKHRSSVSCLYVNKLADIDAAVLEAMVKKSWTIANASAKPRTVEEYIAQVPANAREQFLALRSLVRSIVPDLHHVLSYGIVGYKADPKKRALVFISGIKDHVGIYPVPHDDELRKELAPHIRGKGSLWFELDGELPEDLITKVVQELT